MTTVLASGAATTEHHKLRTQDIRNWLRPGGQRNALVPSEAVGGCARPLAWLLLASCSLSVASAAAFIFTCPSPSVCVCLFKYPLHCSSMTSSQLTVSAITLFLNRLTL